MWKWFFNQDDFALRLFGGFISAFFFSVGSVGLGTRYLLKKNIKSFVRESVPKSHLEKNGTPALGGIFILVAYTISMCVWGDMRNVLVWITFAVLMQFGCIGLLDDISKLKSTHRRGLSIRYKYGLQSMAGLSTAVALYQQYPAHVIHFGMFSFPLGILFIPWAYWVIVGSSNAFNLTDGLDGLAIWQVIIIATGLLLLALQHRGLSISCAKEIAILCSILIGSSGGFVWYNMHPADIFMGDVGALALGAFLGATAIILNEEIIFTIMACVPLVETLSVILQIAVFKLAHKRLFRMAPLHHHLELLGVKETIIVKWFSTMTTFIVALCLLIVTA